MRILNKIWRPLLALLLLFILVKKGPFDLQQLKFVLGQPKIIALGLIIFFGQVVIWSYRWKLFVDLVTYVRFFKTIQLTLVGMFFNFFIPGGVGGDIVKAIELSKNKTVSRTSALSTVMSDRIFGLFAMITLATAFLGLDYLQNPSDFIFKIGLSSLLIFVGITTALLFLPFIFTFISKLLVSKDSKILVNLEKLIKSLHFTFITFRNSKVQLKSFLASSLSQFLAIYYLYSVVAALGVTPPSFLIFFSLCCFGFVASALPIMPGGVGVGQYAFYFLFSNVSEEVGKASITAITTLQIFTLSYALLGGLIFALNPTVKHDVEEYERNQG
ncbi:MAG: hypothetical protein K0R29_1193 [Pseudobdellovibrio sp.]|jgi:uncharacterized protein (TIRG00374 family)|nr:hypothetical protein [Pseudobdellovibrio sp.]